MAVGRTLWDFMFEVTQNPGTRSALVAAMMLLEASLLLLALLVGMGWLTLRLSFGGLEVEVRHLVLFWLAA